jgi:AraC-like DNA-binding protein
MEAAFALTLLLGELSKKPLETEGVEVSASVNRAMASINERLGESFGIKEIAALCDISASHLRKLFRLELGVSIGDYIARRRLASALQLISGKGMKIKELASACGYKSIYAFSRFFKRRTGVSPSRYRLGERKRRRFSSEALLDGFHDAKRSERRSPTKKARRLRKGAGPEKDA